MITLKFNIKTSDDDKLFIINKQKEYSYAFRKLYKHYDKINDKIYIKELSVRYNLSSYLINCLIIDVKTKYEQVKIQKDRLEKEILSITNEINILKQKKKTKKIIKQIFKLNNKLEYKNKHLSKDITFGNLSILRKISYLSNDKINNMDDIIKYKREYDNNRLLPINYIGSLNDLNSNRYFNFDIINNKIIYKPFDTKKIVINYTVSRNIQNQLLKLQEIKDLKLLPISIKLKHNEIYITYNEEILNGYGFDTKEYKNEINKTNKDDKEKRHNIAIKYKKEQEDRKLCNKNINRYCSIDLNPEYIGVSIFDKINDSGELLLIDKFVYDLSKLLSKSNKSSEDSYSKYLNNKRKYEIGVIYKDLFKQIKHYNCAYFVMEDLNFKSLNINNNPAESNRKTKNVWNLVYQINLITKHCNTNGIIIIEVNPVYTSFIGNMVYSYFDPLNAAIEIGRRGIIKYIKGNSLYPILSDTIIDTVAKRFNFPDVQLLKVDNWYKLFNCFKETKFKYRWQLCDINKYNCFSKNNMKCSWNLIRF